MTTPHPSDQTDPAGLRSRAVSSLKWPADQADPDGSAALAVLYQLASSPATAPDALALLHELQVHQVEVDLQTEELRRSRVELESALSRHRQRHEFAPVPLLTLDRHGALAELNRAAASLFGAEGDALIGHRLTTLLAAGSVAAFGHALRRLGEGVASTQVVLALQSPAGRPIGAVIASLGRDPAGDGVLVAIFPAS